MRQLHEWTKDEINELTFGELSDELRRHLGVHLNGSWDGSRVFEILSGLHEKGVESEIRVDSKGMATKHPTFHLRLSFRLRRDLHQKVELLSTLTVPEMTSDSRYEFGQIVGKSALAILSKRARMIELGEEYTTRGDLYYPWSKS